jgi:hypothetical protein
MRSDDHYSGRDNRYNREKSRFTLMPEQKEEWDKCGGEGSRQKFMLEWALSPHGTIPYLWDSPNASQQTKEVQAMHALKDHATSDDDGDSSEHTQGAVDVLFIGNQISKHKETANSIQQESGLINHGAGIKRKDQYTRESAAESPGKEYDVKDPKSIAEYAFRGHEPRGKHADSDSENNDSDNKKM